MKKLLMLVFTMLALSSCATVVHGTTQNMRVKSESNKMITIKDGIGNIVAKGKGEIKTSLDRGRGAFEPARYTVETDGEEVINIVPRMSVGPFLIGNFFLPGWLWYVVDYANGAAFELVTNGTYTESIVIK